MAATAKSSWDRAALRAFPINPRPALSFPPPRPSSGFLLRQMPLLPTWPSFWAVATQAFRIHSATCHTSSPSPHPHLLLKRLFCRPERTQVSLCSQCKSPAREDAGPPLKAAGTRFPQAPVCQLPSLSVHGTDAAPRVSGPPAGSRLTGPRISDVASQ